MTRRTLHGLKVKLVAVAGVLFCKAGVLFREAGVFFRKAGVLFRESGAIDYMILAVLLDF